MWKLGRMAIFEEEGSVGGTFEEESLGGVEEDGQDICAFGDCGVTYYIEDVDSGLSFRHDVTTHN